MSIITGFEVPRAAKDEYTLDLWRKHGLDDSPSLAQIEPVAKSLFTEGKMLEAAAMVLGRCVDAREEQIVKLLVFSDAKEAFGLLLMQLTVEESAMNS